MAVREIFQIGHPKLKAKNRIISNFKSPKIKQIIRDLKDTVVKNGLIGIAGPQIGENYQILVTYPRKTSTRTSNVDQCRVYINPKITFYSEDKSIIYEGCGSVIKGQLFGPVKRPKLITIEATNHAGRRFKLTCDGILARVIQHEYDHLYGIEFTEKISDYSQFIFIDYYRKYIRNSKTNQKASKINKLVFKYIK